MSSIKFQTAIALALFIALSVSANPLPGKFSVSEGQQVVFSPGNLQFHMKDSLWRFAPKQIEWAGVENNLETGNPNFDGWIDLLEWSIGEDNNFGATAQYDTALYANRSFVDWGNLFDTEEWFTMTATQWDFLLTGRDGASDKWGLAKVGDTLGIILLPDEWTAPEGIEFVPRNIPTSELWDNGDMIDDTEDHYRVKNENIPANLFSEVQWTEMEAAGAVFLPYAGRRSGGYGNYLNTKCKVESNMFRYVYFENYLGTYWTASPTTANDRGVAQYIYTFQYNGGDDYVWGRGVIWTENGRYGQSVRLAMKVEDIPTDLDNIQSQMSKHKLIIDGHMYIQVVDNIYTITGQKVQ